MFDEGVVKADQVPGSPEAKAGVGQILGGLTEVQRRALNLIAEGKPVAEIAREVGINRTTIHRWIKLDPDFRAAYNAWQVEQREACQAALLKCARDAVKRIEIMVTRDECVALKVVKELGLFRTSQTLHTDRDRVAREIEAEKMEDETLLEQRRSGGLLPRRASRAGVKQAAPASPAVMQPLPAPAITAPDEASEKARR